MGTVHVDDLKAGMTLAKPVVAPNGRFLLPEGAILKDKNIQVFKIWGVIEVDVVGHDQERIEEQSIARFNPESLRLAEAHLAVRFPQNFAASHFLAETHRLCLLRLAEHLAEGRPLPEAPPLPEALSQETRDTWGGKPSLQELVEGEVQLASFPDVYFRIQEVLEDARSSASHIADVVSEDTSLTAKLLKLVNSSFYGFPSRIESISRAVALIGTNELSTLALGISVVHCFRNIPPSVFDMKSFWQHSVACGVFSRILAREKSGLSEERLFVVGLLHDVGRLVLARRRPRQLAQAIALSRKERMPLFEAEREVFDFDHTQVGGLLLRNWKIPGALETLVRFHHAPLSAHPAAEAAVVNVADALAISLAIGGSGSFYVPFTNDEIWGTLQLAPSILAPTIAQAERQIKEIADLFLGFEAVEE